MKTSKSSSAIKITKKDYKKNGCERYQHLSKEKKRKKYGRKRYKYLREDEK